MQPKTFSERHRELDVYVSRFESRLSTAYFQGDLPPLGGVDASCTEYKGVFRTQKCLEACGGRRETRECLRSGELRRPDSGYTRNHMQIIVYAG